MSNLFQHLKSRWDNCRHQHPGYNYRGSRREGKCLHSYFSCCRVSANRLLCCYSALGCSGRFCLVTMRYYKSFFSKGCQMGVGDTVSNNVSPSIISLLKVVTERKLQGECLACSAKSCLFVCFFILAETFDVIKLNVGSAFLMFNLICHIW